MGKQKDLTNQSNGFVRYLHICGKTPKGESLWTCECLLCGKLCTKRSSDLNSKRKYGCGCSTGKNLVRREDLTGKRTSILE